MRWLVAVLLATFTPAAWTMPRPGPVRPADPENELRRVITRLEVGAPVTYGNLTIFPVKGAEQATRDYLTLDEALGKGYLKVTEVGSGRVDQVQVENTSDRYVFMMAGEVIVGAKQDRMLSDDVVMPPRSGRLLVRVYCTERGRWSGPTVAFGAGGFGGFPELRAAARETESQSSVWVKIRERRDLLAPGKAPTEALRSVQVTVDVQKRLQPYRESKLGRIPELSKDTLGVVVYVGRKVKAADIFGQHSLLERLWPKLLDAYAMDAVAADEKEAKTLVGPADARRFLRQALDARFARKATPGAGELISLRSDRVAGQALLHERSLVHMELFPRGEEPTDYRGILPRGPYPVPPGRMPRVPRLLPRGR